MPEGNFLIAYGPYILAVGFGYILDRIVLSLRRAQLARLYGPLTEGQPVEPGDGGLPYSQPLAPEKAVTTRSRSTRTKPRAASKSGRGRYTRTAEVRRRMSRSQKKRWRSWRSATRAFGPEKVAMRA